MIGILLVLGATLAAEISTSIGKFEIEKHKESIYTLGFLSSFWSCIWFILIVFYKGHFDFTTASLPFFIPRVLLEITLAMVVVRAVATAERSTFGFIRILTIPFLFMVDLAMGVSLSQSTMLGLLLILLTLIVVVLFGGIHIKGSWLVLAAAIIAVGTVSLYNYDITHFNSVEAEQLVVIAILTLVFLGSAIWRGEKPFKLLFMYPYSWQSMAAGLGSVIGSFAYIFAAPSVIMGAQRSSQILWSVISGRLYFKEKNLFLKLTTFCLLTAGIILLIY